MSQPTVVQIKKRKKLRLLNIWQVLIRTSVVKHVLRVLEKAFAQDITAACDREQFVRLEGVFLHTYNNSCNLMDENCIRKVESR